jgi:hypothetical protein
LAPDLTHPALDPPDTRRCLPVRVADVPLEQRVEAVREFNKAFVEDPSERLLLFDLAVSPPLDLVAWIAGSNGNGRRRVTSVETVARFFELRAGGATHAECAARLGVSVGTLRGIARLGRERALERYQRLADEEIARPMRAVLVERLAGWQPFSTSGHTCVRTHENHRSTKDGGVGLTRPALSSGA